MAGKKTSKNDELRNDLETILLKVDLSDLAGISEDILELSADSLLGDGLLKDAPVVGIVAKLYSVSSKLYSYKVKKNILNFFKEYSNGQVDELRREEFLARFQDNQKYRQDVLDTILVSLAQYSDTRQAKVLANLVRAYVNGDISFEKLQACEFALNKLNPIAYKYLDVLSKNETPFVTNNPDRNMEALFFSAGIASRDGFQLRISDIGQDLFIYGIKMLKM